MFTTEVESMVIIKVTPVGNVLINKKCFKSHNEELFFNKVVPDGSKVCVYDIKEKSNKFIEPFKINTRNHRIIINNKKFFICSITEYRRNA